MELIKITGTLSKRGFKIKGVKVSVVKETAGRFTVRKHNSYEKDFYRSVSKSNLLKPQSKLKNHIGLISYYLHCEVKDSTQGALLIKEEVMKRFKEIESRYLDLKKGLEL